MSEPFKMRGTPFQRNFGVGPGLSPHKETDDKTSEKPKVNVKEQGGDQKGKDKGWVKLLKAGTTVASHALASVYGGTAHTPKINWGKKDEAIKDKPSGEDLVDATLKKDAPPPTEVPDYSSSSKGDMSSERDKLRAAGTFDPEGGDPASVAVQNKINELYGSSKRY
tara:strand:+ start:527 stop:1024 length:498 start_codon:yes stop_codon:yes gene_type:complete